METGSKDYRTKDDLGKGRELSEALILGTLPLFLIVFRTLLS